MERTGTAQELHDPSPPAAPELTIHHQHITRPAVVRGSAQPRSAIDERQAAEWGIEVVARRSGGGAVLLVPGHHEWVDVWVPSGHRRWHDDVVRAADWVGDLWATALRPLVTGSLSVHRHGVVPSRWGKQLCFAGIGPGEVSAEGKKLVGVSQRRTREWIRLQTVVHRSWDAARSFGLLTDPEAETAASAWTTAVAEIGDVDVIGAFARTLHETLGAR